MALRLPLKVALPRAEHGGPAIGVLEDKANVKGWRDIAHGVIFLRFRLVAQRFEAGVRWDSDLVGQVPELGAQLLLGKNETGSGVDSWRSLKELHDQAARELHRGGQPAYQTNGF